MNEAFAGDLERALRVAPVTPVPTELTVGRGTALFVDGRCAASGRIRKLEVVFDGEARPVDGWGMPLPERTSGEGYWWAVVPVGPVEERRSAWIELRAEFDDDGRTSARLGSVELNPGPPPPASWEETPQIVICMATYEPAPELFRRQVDSIRAQTHEDWACVISDDASSRAALDSMREILGDDPRFRLETHGERLGFYRNFERALSLAPAGAEFIALSDQDDSCLLYTSDAADE